MDEQDAWLIGLIFESHHLYCMKNKEIDIIYCFVTLDIDS